MQTRIPVHRPYLGDEELEAVRKVFESRWLGLGALTKAFEEQLRDFLGVRHVIAVNTGTAALHLALNALGLEHGDEVIVPSLSFPSSPQAVLAVGARPVFCEVRMDTLNMDIDDALSRVTRRTRAIMPVHYGGRVCEMDDLTGRARERGIRIVEDAAHAFGSTYHGRAAGTLGEAGCFSFDPIKNITCGGGGAIVTNCDDIAGHVRTSHNIGVDTDSWSRIGSERHWLYRIVAPGFRYYMGNLNAAIGLEQLKRFAAFKARKQAVIERYDEAFRGLPGLALLSRNGDEVFPFNYVIRVLNGQRDRLMSHLKKRAIGSTVQFIPLHTQPLFATNRVSLPVTERLYDELLTLPLYFEMTDGDVETVIASVGAFFEEP